ncbi:ABC transporter ATP-binding protein [Desulfofustis limnaeus]|uniref:ABC transporter ATP-binding protein n=1 Tax=Desulfofustis limnaeus TaxID=2740163 RepID=A0ABN6M7W0_9BACT|nr:ABC transporter ATP-binding protein [Desulfofustis limnaeus]MDX9895405.1 ABC transporter ATP-binding protein [Desulfofustis sp.]BDD88104.1 ABC transporter ATP-binding protein [Desulfofustis limnaeus]
MIELQGCSKDFNRGGVNQVRALDDLSIRIEDGDFVTVIGSNGAGKSTLLNAIAGTFRVDSGSIIINGQEVTRWPEYRRARLIARVFQDPLLGTCPSATIEQNLALALRRGQRRGLGPGVRARDRQRFREALQPIGLGLEERLQDRAGLLSGGQRQALTMVMATLVRPDVLLLDEHIAALDPKTAQQILALTARIIDRQRLTALMVTHNMRHALALGNRLIMLHQGRIILDLCEDEKRRLEVADLLERFYRIQGEELANDSMLLA